MCSEYSEDSKPLGGKADIVDGKLLRPNCWYIVLNGEWVEVDFTDGLFHYVVSTKGNLKKLKNTDGDIVYLLSDGDISAHGKTIKSAREELAFKKMSKDVDQFKGMNQSLEKTPKEWCVIYRAITGACSYGVEQFLNSQELKDKYTLKEILTQTEGQYGHEKFKDVVNDR